MWLCVVICGYACSFGCSFLVLGYDAWPCQHGITPGCWITGSAEIWRDLHRHGSHLQPQLVAVKCLNVFVDGPWELNISEMASMCHDILYNDIDAHIDMYPYISTHAHRYMHSYTFTYVHLETHAIRN